jgi:aspartate kinase
VAPRSGSTNTPFRASCIQETLGLVKIGVMGAGDRPGLAAAVLAGISQRGVPTQLVVELADPSGRSHIVFCVSEKRLEDALAAAQAAAVEVGAEQVVCQRDIALIAIQGPHFRDRPGSAAQAFAAVASAGANILAISTSISSICCLVEECHRAVVIDALKKAFDVPDSAVLVAEDGLARPAVPGRWV